MSYQHDREQMGRLARLGAIARLAEIRREQAALEPFLSGAPSKERRFSTASQAMSKAAEHSGRRRMSAAERKAVSARMKAYWAGRRRAKASAKK